MSDITEAQEGALRSIIEDDGERIKITTLRALERKALLKHGKPTLKAWDYLFPPGKQRGKGPNGSYYFDRRANNKKGGWRGPVIRMGSVITNPLFDTEREARIAAGLTGGSTNPCYWPEG
jgi:hypothetical protein